MHLNGRLLGGGVKVELKLVHRLRRLRKWELDRGSRVRIQPRPRENCGQTPIGTSGTSFVFVFSSEDGKLSEEAGMELSERSKGGIRGLIYGVQFAPDPLECVEHIIQHVVQKDRLNSAGDYVALIREALDSETQLSSLLPQPHSEAVIRSFLSEMLAKLTA